MSTNSITDKKFKKLSIQVSLDGLSFCTMDTLTKRIHEVKNVSYKQYPSHYTDENNLWRALLNFDELTSDYDEVTVLHNNNLNTFVPKPFFDENKLSEYLKFNNKIFTSDLLKYDRVLSYDMVNVYVPFSQAMNYLNKQFSNIVHRHSNTILVGKLLELSKNDDATKMYVHISGATFEIIVIKNQQLILFNTFEYSTPVDFLYYILFTAEQLQLNPESFPLVLLGKIDTANELYKIAYKYVRNVQLLQQDNIEERNDFGLLKNIEHFILFHS